MNSEPNRTRKEPQIGWRAVSRSEPLEKNKGVCERLREKLWFKKSEIYIVYWDFRAINPDEIDFKRGDQVTKIKEDRYSTIDGKTLRWLWAKVQNLDTKNKGFIPLSFLVPENDYEKCTLYKNTSWYMGRGHALEARRRLEKDQKITIKGSFLVCAPPGYKSKDGLQEYTIVVRTSEDEDDFKTETTRIYRDRPGRYRFIKSWTSPSLIHLIQSVHNRPEVGCPFELRFPPGLFPGETPYYLNGSFNPIPAPEEHPLRYLFDKATDSQTPLPLINRRDLICDQEPIGHGNFGTVFMAQWLSTKKMPAKSPVVAVKQLSEKAIEELQTFLNETRNVARLKQDPLNPIVKFYGICQEATPIWIVTEFMPNGPLDQFLQKQAETKKLQAMQLIQILVTTAKGMSYLSQENIVHNNLAARNVMVEDFFLGTVRVKISDYGYSFTTDPSTVKGIALKPNKQLFKWKAPELLETQKKGTHQSDIWSFGVVIYEVMTHGLEILYPGINNESQMVGHLESGNRLPRKEIIQKEVYKIVCDCWKMKPEERPKFPVLEKCLESISYTREQSKDT